MNELIRFILGGFLMISGIIVSVFALIGMFRLKSALNRIHASALADTLGILLMLSGLIIIEGFTLLSAKLAAVIVFFWLASPVTGHLISRLEFSTNEALTKSVETIDKTGDKSDGNL